jgi:sialic acid synthase SpsE
MNEKNCFYIEENKIGPKENVYFIADIAANHDGDLGRAKELIWLAANAGADAAKFQHFSAETIVSDIGFKKLGKQQSHQSEWKKSVFEVYQDASIHESWTAILSRECKAAGITFLTSPYSLKLVDEVDNFVAAYKVGSGDITWHEIIEHMLSKGKPILLASGASSAGDVDAAMKIITSKTSEVVLMQCNTNYTGSLENFRYINLNVLKNYRRKYPNVTLGLSDHTPGHTTVLGAVALGATVVEKHFTDRCDRSGPDHKFSMTPETWREMVSKTRELELALGDGVKRVEKNERETVILQRRCVRASENLSSGSVITKNCILPLRPCPPDGIPAHKAHNLFGKRIKIDIKKGDIIRWSDIASV